MRDRIKGDHFGPAIDLGDEVNADNNPWGPHLGPDGHTLYYIDATQHLMAASITEGTPMGIGRPARVPGAPDGVINVTSAPGGRLLILHDDKRNRVPLTVMTRWPATLGEK